MGKAKRRHSSPWLCGGDSTAVAPGGLARKHELRATHVFVNPTTVTTDDGTGAGTKKKEEKKRQKSLLSLLTRRGASTTWLLPSSARKAPPCSGSAAELPGSEQLEGEVEERREEKEKDGNTDVHLQCSPELPEKSKDTSFILGLGAGLLFLYAKSAAEVNKMTELRAEIENSLKEVKAAIPRTSRFSDSGSTVYSQVTWPLEVQTATNSISPEDGQLWSHEQHSLWHDYVSYGHANYPTARSQMMEQVEAELESELERLQLNLKYNGYEKSPLELEIDDSSDFSRMDGDDRLEHIGNELSLGCKNGVCPRELERRLYQLRDVQQQERISELEAALQSTERTLREKEMVIQWWQNTNCLVHNAGRNSC